MSTDETSALYPLTICDFAQQYSVTKGWIVEGAIDVEKLKGAFDRVVAKWPMLAGRIVVDGNQARPYIRIPLGPLPPNYEAYTISTKDSPVPLSHYTPVPMPAFSEVLPQHLFLPENVIHKVQYKGMLDRPIVHWHITRFPQKGEEYSCIGMQYPHAVFDGVGSSLIAHALIAELAGKPWEVPPPTPPIAPGVLENPFTLLMEKEVDERSEETLESALDALKGLSIQNVWGLLLFFVYMLWEKLIEGRGAYNVVIPYRVHSKLVEEAREEAKAAGKTDAHIGTGDVIYAWLMKSMQEGTKDDPNKTIFVWSQATLRKEWSNQLELYPHNCNVGQSLPLFTLGEVTSEPLSALSYKLARGRLASPRTRDAVRCWRIWQHMFASEKLLKVVPGLSSTDYTIPMSNVSMSRVVDLDWTPVGGGRTVGHYVRVETRLGTPPTFLIINGRLRNGDLVMTLYTTRVKGRRIEEELKKLMRRFD